MLLQFDWLAPALATVGTIFISVTDEEDVQAPSVIVQTSVAELPDKLTPLAGLSGEAISAFPPLTVHRPVSPDAGRLAFRVN